MNGSWQGIQIAEILIILDANHAWTKKIKGAEMARKRIVWLHPYTFSSRMKQVLVKCLEKVDGVEPADVIYYSLTKGCTKTAAQGKMTVKKDDAERIARFHAELHAAKPDFIVINDIASLYYITEQYESLSLCRGGIYYWGDIPCIVVDRVQKIMHVKHAKWVLLSDLRKLSRWVTDNKRDEPALDYKVCKTVADVEEYTRQLKENAILAAKDIETSHGKWINTIGDTLILRDGRVKTWVIPFITTQHEDGCYWRSVEDEIAVWSLLREAHAEANCITTMQNGLYDSCFFVKYRLPIKNYLADSLHLFHSIWAEAPKRIDFIASMLLDNYTYWKDAKNVKEERLEQAAEKGIALPKTQAGLDQFWLYNARDCHNTALATVRLLDYWQKLDWVQYNYKVEMSLQIGPMLATTMRGIKIDKQIRSAINTHLMQKHQDELQKLRTMVDDAEFNPGSAQQVCTLLYDILGAKPIRKKRTSSEKYLKLVATQHPLYDILIKQIWDVKKPLNNASKYGMKALLNGRYMYQQSAAGTDTGRLNAKQHPFWLGSNIQNWPKIMQVMAEPDSGYVFWEIDYSSSDAWFTADAMQEMALLDNLESPDDTHCRHAEFFFKKPYDEILQGKKEGADWVVDPIKGVRQNTKRICYGANYLMTGYTLYVTMGREAVIESAKAIGFKEAEKFTEKQLVKICDYFLGLYFKMYPELKKNLDKMLRAVAANGNKATCAFGKTRIFFGNVLGDSEIQRQIASYFGQGGTAGNINDALLRFYWESGIEQEGSMVLFQVHDSLSGMSPISKFQDHVPRIMRMMENEVQSIHPDGRGFKVPVEASIGFGWGKRMMDFDFEKNTLEDVKEFDRKWWKKFEAEYL